MRALLVALLREPDSLGGGGDEGAAVAGGDVDEAEGWLGRWVLQGKPFDEEGVAVGRPLGGAVIEIGGVG